MSDIEVHICPETGICTILKEGGTKVDLMPDEAQAIRGADGDADTIREVISRSDGTFAEALEQEEIDSIAKGV